MSHYVSYDVKFTEKEFLVEAIRKMDFEAIENQNVTAFGDTRFLDIAVAHKGKVHPVGFVLKNAKREYELLADFWKFPYNSTEFQEAINMNYSLAKVENAIEESGWVQDSMEVNENGEMEVTAYVYQ